MNEAMVLRGFAKATLAVCSLIWLAGWMTTQGWAYDGELDPGFAGDGIMAIVMGSGDASANGVAAQNDGHYVLVGVAEDTDKDFGIARVTPIGSMDGTFGTSGKAYWDSGWGDDGGWDVAIQDDGKIVAVGTARLETAFHLTVLRFNTDGTPDLTFGFNGYSIINFGISSYGRGLVIQPDGKIVVVANSASATFAVARLDTSGALDASFGSGGFYTDGTLVPIGIRDAWDVGLFVDGRIAVAGSQYNSTLRTTSFCVQIMDSSGLRLSHTTISFGNPLLHASEARAVAVQPDNKIVVAGFTESDTAIAVARLDSDGVLDPSFDTDGKNTVDFGEGVDEGWDLALQPDGKILVVGSAIVDGVQQAVVIRFLADGYWDKFGPDVGGASQRYVAFYFGTESRARSVTLLPNAEMLVAGDAVGGPGRILFLAARLDLPSLWIFADGFESGDPSEWSSTVP